MIDEARAARLRRNEEMFRAVNERIAEITEPFAEIAEDPGLELVCECSHAECTERLTVGRDAYRAARADPDTFLVLPGHEEDELEDVVARTPTYLLVRKRG